MSELGVTRYPKCSSTKKTCIWSPERRLLNNERIFCITYFFSSLAFPDYRGRDDTMGQSNNVTPIYSEDFFASPSLLAAVYRTLGLPFWPWERRRYKGTEQQRGANLQRRLSASPPVPFLAVLSHLGLPLGRERGDTNRGRWQRDTHIHNIHTRGEESRYFLPNRTHHVRREGVISQRKRTLSWSNSGHRDTQTN